MRLKGKVAIITGAGQGIGHATAIKFAQEGAKVALCDINRPSVDAAVEEIIASGGQALGFVVDVTEKQSIARMVEGVMGAWGRIDTLVNNAGIVQDAQFRKMTDEQFERVIDVNLKGVYNVTKAVVDIMLEQNSGCILNASSIVGLYGNFGQTNYAATKFGVIGMVKTWARELGRKGIRANAICPGFISTPILASMPAKIVKMMEDGCRSAASAGPRRSRTPTRGSPPTRPPTSTARSSKSRAAPRSDSPAVRPTWPAPPGSVGCPGFHSGGPPCAPLSSSLPRSPRWPSRPRPRRK
jgi:3-oxoacyl-[acyl-carrier protein] reductase